MLCLFVCVSGGGGLRERGTQSACQATKDSTRRPVLLRRLLPSMLRTCEFWKPDVVAFGARIQRSSMSDALRDIQSSSRSGKSSARCWDDSNLQHKPMRHADFLELQVRRKARYQCCIRKHQEVTALILKAPNPESVTKKSVVCFRGFKGNRT